MSPKSRAGHRNAKDSKAGHPNNDSEAKILCDEAAGHLKTGNYKKALNAYNSALELNPNDKNALVARSKCYLLLGEPQMALQDAETALQEDKNFIRGLFQKAESLYHLGDFEHSLMYYHRGLRLRPELEGFRLGVQKAQEAIENTIGSQSKAATKVRPQQPCPSLLSGSSSEREKKSGVDRKRDDSSTSRSRPASSSSSQRQSRHLLGELSLDKEYLEQLLRHPDIKCCSNQRKNNNIATFAEEGIAFLKNRQEFWRQQRPTATSKKVKERQQTTESTTHRVH